MKSSTRLLASNGFLPKWTSLASLLTVAVALCLPSSGTASITVMDSGERYRSRADHVFGKAFVRGGEYMARLQYLEGNLHLCPSASQDKTWNLTHVPPDMLPGTFCFAWC